MKKIEVHVTINTGQKYYTVYVLFYTSPTVCYEIPLRIPVEDLQLNHGDHMKIITNDCNCLLKKYQNEKLEIDRAREVWNWVHYCLGEYVV